MSEKFILIHEKKKKISHIPNLLSVFRILTSPLLFFFIIFGSIGTTTALFIVDMVSDAMDGYIARKFGFCSILGSYLDIIGDFLSIFSILIGFTLIGIYPIWIIITVLVIFLQFLATSKYKELVYDPIGKYYGSFLFVILMISLIDVRGYLIVQIILFFIGFTTISVVSRIFALFNLNKKN